MQSHDIYKFHRIFLLQKRAFRLIANVNHIPYHLIQTSDLQTSLNLVPFPQLASKFICIFGDHVLNSTCPDFSVEDFLFTHTTDSSRDKHLLQYHNDPLRHKIVTSFKALPYNKQSSSKLYTFKRLFIYIFNTDFSLKCFCCFINIVFHLLFCFSYLLGT